MEQKPHHARQVRQQALELLARERLAWDEATPESRQWWEQFLARHDTDLETALRQTYQLLYTGHTLRESRALLETVVAVMEELPSLVEGDYDSIEEALQTCDEALATAPWDFHIPLTRAFLLNRQGRFLEALAACEAVLRHDPGSDRAFNNRGFALLGLGRYDEALVSCTEAIWLNPENASAFSNQGNALCLLRRYDEAVRAFEQALAREGGSAAIYNNYGEALVALERYSEAQQVAEQALALQPQLASAHGIRGAALYAQGEYSAAAESFQQADRAAQLQRPIYLFLHAVALLASERTGSQQEGVRLLASPRLRVFEGKRLLLLRTYQYLYALSRQGQLLRLAEVKRFIVAGESFPEEWHYSMEPCLRHATRCGHEDSTWIPSLLAVLHGRQSPRPLTEWPLWQSLTLSTS